MPSKSMQAFAAAGAALLGAHISSPAEAAPKTPVPEPGMTCYSVDQASSIMAQNGQELVAAANQIDPTQKIHAFLIYSDKGGNVSLFSGRSFKTPEGADWLKGKDWKENLRDLSDATDCVRMILKGEKGAALSSSLDPTDPGRKAYLIDKKSYINKNPSPQTVQNACAGYGEGYCNPHNQMLDHSRLNGMVPVFQFVVTAGLEGSKAVLNKIAMFNVDMAEPHTGYMGVTDPATGISYLDQALINVVVPKDGPSIASMANRAPT